MSHIFLGYFVVRDLCRRGCRQNFAIFYITLLPPSIFGIFHGPYPQFSQSLTQVTVIWNQGAPKASFGTVYISLLVTLRKVFRRASCKALRWDKANTISRVCIIQYSTLNRSMTVIGAENCSLLQGDHGLNCCIRRLRWPSRVLGVKSIRREQKCRWSLTLAGSGVKTESMLVCRPCDFTSGKLE